MNITSITLENFKGFKKSTKIDLKPITLLFGGNSAGKSTILQAFLYLSEIINNDNCDPEKSNNKLVEDLGSFDGLINKQARDNGDNYIKFRIEVALTSSDWELRDPEGMNTLLKEKDIKQSDLEKIKNSITTMAIEYQLERSMAIITDYEPEVSNTKIFLNSDKEPVIERELMEISRPNSQLHTLIDTNNKILHPFKKRLEKELEKVKRTVLDFTLDQSRVVESMKELEKKVEKEVQLHGGLIEEEGKRFEVNNESYLANIIAMLLLDVIQRKIGKQLIEFVKPLRTVPKRGADNEIDYAGVSGWDNLDYCMLHELDQGGEYGREHEQNSRIFEINEKIKMLDLGYEIKTLDVCSSERVELAKISAIRYKIAKEKDTSTRKMLMDDFFDKNFLEETLVYLKEINTGNLLHPRDVGSGISQVIPVILSSFSSEKLVAIQQPELHIHPRLQIELGDLFASRLVRNSPPVKKSGISLTLATTYTERTGIEIPVTDTIHTPMFLIETHSEHLMLRLLRRIRETLDGELPEGAPSLKKEDVAVLYVEKKDGEIKISEQKITDDGDFEKDWPGGFFGERAKELF